MKQTFRLATATIACIAISTLSACSGSGDDASDKADVVSDGSLTIGLGSDPGNLDPQSSVAGVTTLLAQFAYDTPVALDKDKKVVPQVVTKWEAGDKSYVLTVKDGITCSDGSDLTADTVAANINYVGNPENEVPLAGVAVPSGTTATADEAAATVTVALPSAAPFFLQGLALLPLVCDAGLADRDSLAAASNGSGPFVIEAVVPGDQITYAVREGYTWGPDGAGTATKGIPAKLTFKVVTDTTTTANLLLNGQLNIARTTGSDQDRLKAAGLESSGTLALNDLITFNQAEGSPVADVQVRRALVMALDIPELASVATSGYGSAANGLLADPKICAGDTMKGFLPDFDVTGAQTLLEDNGWIAGDDGIRTKGGEKLTVELLYGNTPAAKANSAEYLAAQWKKIGVDVKLDLKPEDQTISTLFSGTGTWDAVLEAIGVSNAAALTPFLSGPVPPDGTNFGQIKNADYDALIAKASSEDVETGCADWNAAESALFENADTVPVSVLPQLFWSNGASVDVVNDSLVPTSLRVLGN